MPALIVVGIDGSPASRAALDWALAEAKRRRVPVLVVHAWQPDRHPAWHFRIPDPESVFRTELLPALCDYPTDDPIVVESLVEGPPVEALAEAARPAAMLVVGATHAGLTAEACLHRTSCPVIAVPALAVSNGSVRSARRS
jgi:nucleotide-binding universal stress UspA family protein